METSEDTRIKRIKLIGAQLRDGTAFHLNIKNGDADDFLVETHIDVGTPRRRVLRFPHFLPRTQLKEWPGQNWKDNEIRELTETGRWNPYYDEQGHLRRAWSSSLSRRQLDRLTNHLTRHAELEIGFHHTDLEPKMFDERKWFGGEDADDDKCGCRFVIRIREFESEWWTGWYRPKRVLLCTRDEDQLFDRVWKYRDQDGWGLGY